MSATDFLDSLNARNARKRESQKALARELRQSPTVTESDFLHGINITRFAEMYKHDRRHFQGELEARIAWQIASREQRGEIMAAICSGQH